MTHLGEISPIIALLGVISPARVEKCYRSAHLWGNFANVEPCLWGNFANAACYLNRYLWEAVENQFFKKAFEVCRYDFKFFTFDIFSLQAV